MTRGVSSLMFEQSDSPLRLVLSLSDPARSAADVAAGGASTTEAVGASTASAAIAAPTGWANVSAPLAAVAPSTGAPKVLGPNLVPLDAPAVGSSGEFFSLLLAESNNTPEPGTLALAALGLCALRVVCGPARKKRRVEV
jgi:hypothetical protein